MSISGSINGAPETPILPQPSLPWRAASSFLGFNVGLLSRAFLFGLNNTNVHGLEQFIEVLESRADTQLRTRGLLTVSNHISVIDEPLIWGVIPLTVSYNYLFDNYRYSLAARDICFKNGFTSYFFTLVRTLPTVRLAHDPRGGLFQPTMTEAVRLLSRIRLTPTSDNPYRALTKSPSSFWFDCVDPFSETSLPPSYAPLPYTDRNYLSPSSYASNSYSWIHIFPEGMTHQTTDQTMRYFKWGVSRLILEPEECPDLIPMFIEGSDQVMHATRTFPRFLPRAGKKIDITFGDKVDTEEVFGDLRKKWRDLVAKDPSSSSSTSLLSRKEQGAHAPLGLGVLSDFLKYSPDAVALRIECTRRVREEVLKVRRSRGLPDEDPKAGLVETWAKEGTGTRKEGGGKVMDDGSRIEDV